MSEERIGFIPKESLRLTVDDNRLLGTDEGAHILECPLPEYQTLQFGERPAVEDDASLLQIISVGVLIDHLKNKVLVVRKNKDRSSCSEKGRDLIWIGGHSQETDWNEQCATIADLARNTLTRELDEELGIAFEIPPSTNPILVYDSSNDHSSRHLAVCYIVPLSFSSENVIIPKEHELDLPTSSSYSEHFVEVESLLSNDYHLDSWSVAIAQYLKKPKTDLNADVIRRLQLIHFDQQDDGLYIGNHYCVGHSIEDLTVLGHGGSSIVVQAIQKLEGTGLDCARLSRAVKFFLFNQKLAEELHTSIAGENYRNELNNIIQLNHQNILKVIDGGTCLSNLGDGQRIPYMVTELVEGHTLQRLIEVANRVQQSQTTITDEQRAWVIDVIKDEEQVFKYCLEILDGLCYLHARKFYHCDIAPKNIFLQEQEGSYHIILGDLGAGARVSDDSTHLREKQIRIIGSKRFMPEEALNLYNRMVAFDVFQALQPRWDMYSTVQTLIQFTKSALSVLNMPEHSSHSGCHSLEVLAAYLSEVNFHNLTAEELRAKIEWLGPSQTSIAKVPELSEANWQTNSRLLPISAYISTPRIEKLIRHDAMQRLRKVPQLLMGSFIFPGANHTRLEHSLGTYEMMRKVLRAALQDKRCTVILDRRSIEIALIGALMMSATRFPYSYIIHEVKHQGTCGRQFFPALSRRKLFKEFLDYTPTDHQGSYRTVRQLIGEYFPLIPDTKGKSRPDEIALDDLIAVVCGPLDNQTFEPQLQFIYSLLHSTIDVRVLDFLARDAYHLGEREVPDFSDLIYHLTEWNNRVAIKRTGQSSAERVVVNRYWMFKRFYWNQPSRIFTAAATWAFCEVFLSDSRQLLSSRGCLCAEYCSAMPQRGLASAQITKLEELIIERFLESDTRDMTGILRQRASDLNRKDVVALIDRDFSVDNHPPHYTRLTIFHPNDSDATIAELCQTYRTLGYQDRDAIRRKVEDAVLKAAGEFLDEETRSTIPPIVLVDMPCSDEDKLGQEINVLMDENTVVKLSDCSPFIENIIQDFSKQLRLLRVFIDKDYQRKHRDKLIDMTEATRNCLLNLQL